MLSVANNPFILSLIMRNDIMLNVITLNVITLNVITLNVTVPSTINLKCFYFYSRMTPTLRLRMAKSIIFPWEE